jgi:hypothetical protein
MDDRHNYDDDVAAKLGEAMRGIHMDLGSTISSALGDSLAGFDDVFKSITASWQAQFDGVRMAAAESVAAALKPTQALTGWAESINRTSLAGLELAGASAVTELAKSIDFSSGRAFKELAGLNSTFDLVRASAFGSVADQLGSLDRLFPSHELPASILADFPLPDIEFDLIGNPLLAPMLELTETNTGMHRRLEEMTAVNREIRDQMAGLRQWQAESDKGAERWSKREVGIAFVALLVSVAALAISLVQIL